MLHIILCCILYKPSWGKLNTSSTNLGELRQNLSLFIEIDFIEIDFIVSPVIFLFFSHRKEWKFWLRNLV